MTTIGVPELSLVVLMGASGSGKSTFARRHFRPTEILSSDFFRGLVADDETDQSATADAFELLHAVAAKRLAAGRLTVVDATNVQPEARKPLVALARQYHCLPVAIVLDVPERLCRERNRARPERTFGPHVIRQQVAQLRRSLRGLDREGFRHVHILDSLEAVEGASVRRDRLWNDRRDLPGPFDVVGDVHGCAEELRALLARLGYLIEASDGPDGPGYAVGHPEGRTAVFLGDLVDRGPDTPGVLRLVMAMVGTGTALCVPGNHDVKLLRKLRGRDVQITHGLAESLAQLAAEPAAFVERVKSFLDGLVSHYVLDQGRLVVSHAGLRAEMHGRGSGAVRDFCLFGETTGETDEYGLPRRYDWAAEYRGRAMVVYGHTPVPEPEWLNGTICIDTGCVFGGRLTALRYPERELVSVEAARTYYEPVRPFFPEAARAPALTAQQRHDALLDLEDVSGKRGVATRLHGRVAIREGHAAAALEVMSRFAADPRWLVYLPPTMSPPETSREPGLLEHPAEALAYYRHEGVPRVVCEEKHMGSRAVLVVCRDEDAARRRFGVAGEPAGIVYTRTGRRFFEDEILEAALLDRVRRAIEGAGLWRDLEADWVLLDAELLPWSAKAGPLLRAQYAPTGRAATVALDRAVGALAAAEDRGLDTGGALARARARADMAKRFVEAYRRYCWPVSSLDDLRVAPFQLLASGRAVHVDRDQRWHLEAAQRLAAAGPDLLLATRAVEVDLADPASQREAVAWWEALTAAGGEGMVVKPLDPVTRGRKGFAQPGIKCRGPEYLRIIYGAEYTVPEHLERLRTRSVSAKRALALREFALGVEGLERFARGEPLRRVHECVFAVLALESEPVDPRL